MKKKNIVIVGGGNIGLCMLGEISRLGKFRVTIVASDADKYVSPIKVVDDERRITFSSGPFTATSKLENAIPNADIILCTYPSFLRERFVKEITPMIKRNALLGFFPGYGGAEFFCEEIIEKGGAIFALQKVPYVARTKERGKIAGLWSRKDKLFVGTIPVVKTAEVADLIQDIFLIRCEPLSNYMQSTLLPGNPLLHTAGSYVYLKNYSPGNVFPEQIYFYQNWTDEHSRFLCDLSNEMISICKALPIDLSGVQSIQEYYESPTPEDVTRKFNQIPSFKMLTLPMKKIAEGFVPDFSSRFFVEDIPFGAVIIKSLGLLADVATPCADRILQWYKDMSGKEYFLSDGSYGKDFDETGAPQRFGFTSAKDLADFYLR